MDIKQIGAELLEILKQGLVSGSKLVAEQFLILCQQIITWGIVGNICIILLSVCMMVIAYHLAMFAIKKQKEAEWDDYWLFLSIPSISVGIIFFIICWMSIFELGKILVAPNVYLLDYFKGVVIPQQG
jgi:hypothetical protein